MGKSVFKRRVKADTALMQAFSGMSWDSCDEDIIKILTDNGASLKKTFFS